MARTVMIALACGLAGDAHAELLSTLRIVQWETPIAEFRPESIRSLLRSLDLNETEFLPLPRYLEFRHDLVRITAASGVAWYLIPLSPDISYRGDAD
ncbi:hypothetical protein N7I30_21090 [Aurantimonas litoralis]|nr:hypothetical protein [Aurantimonas litoralis]